MTINIPNLAALPAAATTLATAIAESGHSVVAFEGEMGAGKTTLIRALGAALGVADDVSSPTFALVNEYRDGQVAARRLPPRWFKLSYLVTAWTQRPEDEHRILSQLLRTFLRHDCLPDELVTGALAEMHRVVNGDTA